jgi:hypothetical protein
VNTATEFLDHYGESLGDSAAATLRGPRFLDRVQRFKAFNFIRLELKARGVSDEDILSNIRQIMAFILANLGDFVKILALVLPLFFKTEPKAATASEHDIGGEA